MIPSDAITFSKIQAFLTCRRRYYYRYVLGIEQAERPIYFSTGTAIHLALAKWYSGDSLDHAIDEIVNYFFDNKPDADNIDKFDKWNAEMETATQMMRWYTREYLKEKFEVSLSGIEKEFCLDFNGAKLAGKVDALVSQSGILWIMEHKTTRVINTELKRRLTLDMQSVFYTWAMSQVLEKGVQGVIYNVLLKDYPEWPKILKNGSLSIAKNQTTTPELFREAIQVNELNEIDYAEYLVWLEANRKDFFYREYLAIGNQDRKEMELELKFIIEDMMKLTSIYRNTNQCSSNHGICPYFDICIAPDKDAVIEASYIPVEQNPELSGEEI